MNSLNTLKIEWIFHDITARDAHCDFSWIIMTNECRRAVEYWWEWSDIEEYLACSFIDGKHEVIHKILICKTRERERKSHWHVCSFTKAWREIKINFFVACKVKSQLIYSNRYLTTHFRCQSISENLLSFFFSSETLAIAAEQQIYQPCFWARS